MRWYHWIFIGLMVVTGAIIGILSVRQPKPAVASRFSLQPLDPSIQSMTPTPQPTATPAVVRTARLRIPALGTDAPIEPVGLDARGYMDVPSTYETVAWYELGPKPGSVGSAVLAGHYDTINGTPAVFYALSRLRQNDALVIDTEAGERVTYKVTRTVLYPETAFPIAEVFGQADKARLNLITCANRWDPATHSYSHRLVVYSERV